MKKIFNIVPILFLVTFSINAQEGADAGKAIFNNRCASCHAVGKKLVGPDLKDVDQRHNQEWIVNFVRHSQQVIKSGDKAAVTLFEEYNKTLMPDHLDLTATDIDHILSFIKEESVKVANAPSSPRVPDRYKPYEGESSLWHQIVYLDLPGEHTPVTKNDTQFWVVLTIIFIVIVSVFYAVVKVNQFVDKLDKKNPPSNQ